MTSNKRYNYIDEVYVESYLPLLVGKVYKLLPLKEENSPTLDKYHESLMFELTGFCSLAKDHVNKALLFSIISSIESLDGINDIGTYKRKVFECINSVKKLMQ